jgi:hypothetical protein
MKPFRLLIPRGLPFPDFPKHRIGMLIDGPGSAAEFSDAVV